MIALKQRNDTGQLRAALASNFCDHKLKQRTDRNPAIALSSGVAGLVERRKPLGDWSAKPRSSWRSTSTRFGGGGGGGGRRRRGRRKQLGRQYLPENRELG